MHAGPFSYKKHVSLCKCNTSCGIFSFGSNDNIKTTPEIRQHLCLLYIILHIDGVADLYYKALLNFSCMCLYT